ncbi:m-AAA protease-interacting protein 1, mitochondrial-like [Artemia franciscana]
MSCKIFVRKFSNSGPKFANKYPVFLFQNPFEWISVKLDAKLLQNKWDKEFNIELFKEGSKQALAAVTQYIKKNDLNELTGLLTREALNKFKEEVSKWDSRAIEGLPLQTEDIQGIRIRKIDLQTIVEKRYCDIDVITVSIKEVQEALLLYDIRMRFHREYSEGKLPEWTLTKFVLESFKRYDLTK